MSATTLTDQLGRMITAPAPDESPADTLARLATTTLVAVDVETTGTTWADTLRTVQLGTMHEALVLRADVPGHMGQLREWFASTSMPLTAHNASFDIRFLVNAKIAGHRELWDRMIDTLLLDQLIRPGDGWTRPEHGLKAATRVWCGDAATAADAKDAMKKWWRSLGIKTEAAGWRESPLDGAPYLLYGAADVFDGATLAATLVPLVDGLLGQTVREREHRIARLVHGITMRGMRIDVTAVRKDLEVGEAEAAAMREHLITRYGIANPASGPQLLTWFAGHGVQTTSTAEAALLALGLDGEPATFRTDLLAWRERSKAVSTYLRPLAATPADADGVARLHPDFGTLDARTGRMASRGPNVQNFPPNLRKYVVAEPGMSLVDADFSAVEVRIAAGFAKDAALMQTFCEGRDPYIAAAEAAWGSAPDEATRKANRSRAKPLLLGHIYGRGPNTIAAALGVSREEAVTLQARLDAAMPDVPRYVARARARVATGRTAGRLPSGRVVQVHPATQYTAAVNSVVQGHGRELLADALLALDDAGLGEVVWLPVHDEWILQAPIAKAEEICRVLEQAMTMQVGEVPVTAEAAVMGQVWSKL
jgi:DNA polymerase-1